MSKKDIQHLYQNELGITDANEIDIEAIAFYLDAVVKYKPLKGCEARIVGGNDKAIITINSESMPQRNRFSIGHELGHWIKHRGSIGNLCKKESIIVNRASYKDRIVGKERIANNYASELLIPNYLIEKYIDKHSVSFETVQALKNAFDVSYTAAAIRYINFCDYPVILACYHKNTGRKWFHRSKEVPKYFYPVKNVDASSPGFRKLNNSTKQRQPNEVDANTWVDYRGSFHHEVMEVLWPISNDMFMVFIWWENEEQLIGY